MKKKSVIGSSVVAVLIVAYFLGPYPSTPKFDPSMPVVPQEAKELERYVTTQEAKHKLKPDNEARIIWSDTTKQKTEYSVVYLHGFSASPMEGNPVHLDFAKKFGCNLYLARMADHGVDTVDQLLYFTPDRWWASAKEALAIGKAIGKKVIVMSTSTGGTLALMLAAEYPEDVFALVNMSPNIAINDSKAWIANNPWGLQVARMVFGGKSRVFPKDTAVQRYWNDSYRLESVSQLQELLEVSMNDNTFKKIKCPSLTLYYFKNEQEQDPQVKVSAMLEMNKQLSTADSMKETVAIPNAGGHVLGSSL